jgi:hypothetical protein
MRNRIGMRMGIRFPVMHVGELSYCIISRSDNENDNTDNLV